MTGARLMTRWKWRWPLAGLLALAGLGAVYFVGDPWGWFDPEHRAASDALGAAGTRIERGWDRRVQAVHYLRPASSNEDLAHLVAFPSLKGVDLKMRRNMTNEDLRYVARLKSLEWLGLATLTGISDAGLEHLKGLTNLRQLNLANTRVTDEGLKE
jgi:hypothetical protein